MLFYREIGQSKDLASSVVLLHGLFGMSDNLLGLAKELGESFHVIVPDLINHGKSPHREIMNYPIMAKDVFELLDELELEKVSVFGHSVGGKVAMQMAFDQPEKIHRVVVADISPVAYPPHHTEIIWMLNLIGKTTVQSRKDADDMLAKVIDESSLRQFFLKNLERVVNDKWQWRFGLTEITNAYVEILAAPINKGNFNGEVLFIKGELSEYIKDEHQDLILAMFPKATLKVIQGASHWLHAEKPQVFNRIVKNFLN